TGDCHGSAVEEIECLAGQDDFQRSKQRGQLARLEKVVGGRWPPAKLTLPLEKRFHHKVPARANRLRKLRHSATVEIVENQHEVERTFRNLVMLEIGLYPFDGQVAVLRGPATALQPAGVNVHRGDVSSELGSGDRMPARTGCEIENARPRMNHGRVPAEPTARLVDGRR